MEISGTNIGASTYAMKKAMEMSNILMNLIQNSSVNGVQALGTKSPIPQSVNISSSTGKGELIDLVE